MTVQITAAMIKELRERTGVGIDKCKKALEEAKGDMETAISNLRKAGIATAVKKEGREAKEGMIAVTENGKHIAVVEVNAETDFVVKNDLFGRFLQNIAQEVVETAPANLEKFLSQKYSKDGTLTIDEYRATIVQSIGENIQIRRFILIPKTSDKSIGVYSHLGGKIVTMAEITGSAAESGLAKDIAMHIAAASPDYLSPEKIPAAILDNEKEIAKSQMKDKPANIMDKIVEGKLNSFYDAVCLVRQKYIKDDSLTIQDLVSNRSKETGKPLALSQFIRWVVGQS
jgi:elongation factor Ts